jgi:hypothetical protein
MNDIWHFSAIAAAAAAVAGCCCSGYMAAGTEVVAHSQK